MEWGEYVKITLNVATKIIRLELKELNTCLIFDPPTTTDCFSRERHAGVPRCAEPAEGTYPGRGVQRPG